MRVILSVDMQPCLLELKDDCLQLYAGMWLAMHVSARLCVFLRDKRTGLRVYVPNGWFSVFVGDCLQYHACNCLRCEFLRD